VGNLVQKGGFFIKICKLIAVAQLSVLICRFKVWRIWKTDEGSCMSYLHCPSAGLNILLNFPAAILY